MSRVRTQFAHLARRVVTSVVRRPRVKRLARFVLDHTPVLQTRLHAWVHRGVVAPPRRYHVPLDKDDLSPRMQSALNELEQYVKARKR